MEGRQLYETINTNLAKMLVVSHLHIGEIVKFDYEEMKRQHELKNRVYVINLDGIFLFVNNRLKDGVDYIKLRDSSF